MSAPAEVAVIEGAEPLPSPDYMRGYLVHYCDTGGPVLDDRARGWLNALIDEVELLRNRLTVLTVPEMLTESEARVYQFLRGVAPYSEIARVLHISINTLKTHQKNIYRKLGVASRAELRALDRD